MKKWQLAYYIIRNVNFSFGTSGWLSKHAECCAKSLNEYKSYSRSEMISSRLSTLNHRFISTSHIHAGLINIGAMVHTTFDFQSEKEVKIFEKIFHINQTQLVNMELLLFDQIDTNEIAAPKFIGKLKNGSFISMFYEYIKGFPLNRKDREVYKYKLIKKLWRSNPTKRIIDLCAIHDQVDLLLSNEHMDSLIEVSTSNHDRIIIESIKENASLIVKDFRSLPRIIVHKDLNQNNVIKSKAGEFYLIDWDKWCVSNVGGGLLIHVDEIYSPTLKRGLSDFVLKTDPFSMIDILKNICIYNFANNLRYKRYGMAIEWGLAYEKISGSKEDI